MGNEAVLLLTEVQSFIKIAIVLELPNTVCIFLKGSRSDPRNYLLQDVTNRLKWKLKIK